MLIDRPITLRGELWPAPEFVAPVFTAGALISIALPLFVVTMASQNIPGMGVLASFGYRPPLRPLMVGTGLASVAGAPFGGHAVNLAAITAALMAGPDAHPDPARRWVVTAASGGAYWLLALAASVATAFVDAAPELLVEAVAGLALLGVLGSALAGRGRRRALPRAGGHHARRRRVGHHRAEHRRAVLGARRRSRLRRATRACRRARPRRRTAGRRRRR